MSSIPEPSVYQTLQELNSSLESSLKKLKTDPLKSALQRALHDDKKLPDKDLNDLAGRTVDLLGEIDTLLEPAHLVLADHFFGA
jgi:gliotoxin/aspirochlorine biosynthesis O-methyltransferase